MIISFITYIIAMLFKFAWWLFTLGVAIGPIVWFFGRSIDKSMFVYTSENEYINNTLLVIDGFGCLWMAALIIAIYIY